MGWKVNVKETEMMISSETAKIIKKKREVSLCSPKIVILSQIGKY